MDNCPFESGKATMRQSTIPVAAGGLALRLTRMNARIKTMANVKFTGFVNSALTSSEGEVWLLKTAESHRRENDNGEWETTARTFRDVRLSNNAADNLDLSEFAAEGTRITVEGFELTIHTERDGNDYYNLCVFADSIELAESAQQQPAKPVRKTQAQRGNRR